MPFLEKNSLNDCWGFNWIPHNRVISIYLHFNVFFFFLRKHVVIFSSKSSSKNLLFFPDGSKVGSKGSNIFEVVEDRKLLFQFHLTEDTTSEVCFLKMMIQLNLGISATAIRCSGILEQRHIGMYWKKPQINFFWIFRKDLY